MGRVGMTKCMTALPPDPDPAGDPDLDAGGSVLPGSTPPDSGSATLGLSHHEPEPSRKIGPIIIGIVLVLSLVIAALLIFDAFGRFN